MKEVEAKAIKAMCDHSMNVSQACKALYMHRNSMLFHINRIKEAYGLDPRKYRDLVKLEGMIQ